MPTLFKDKITVGSVTFNDYSALPPLALEWRCDVFDAWSNTSEIDAVFTQVGSAAGDGAIPAAYFPARAKQMVLGGAVEASNKADREELEYYLKGTVFPRNQELIVTRFEAVPKFMRVRVSGERQILPNPTKTGFRWAVPVTASDPFKYSVSTVTDSTGVAGSGTTGFTFPITFPFSFTTLSSSSGDDQVVINNGGTFYAPPTIVLTGPLTRGWFLLNETTGQSLRFDLPIDSGSTLTIDHRTETALLDGSTVISKIVGDFWKLAPGNNTVKLYADFNIAAGFTITTHSVWE